MPHLILEYTNNISQAIDTQKIFAPLHQIIAETAGIRIENCKSRAILLNDYYIADGTPLQAFAHLSVRFLEGRSSEIRQSIGQQCLQILRGYFGDAPKELDLQLTVEIGDIQRQSYFKFPNGTL
ncbi:MAG: 5-carboxymethyl-2-hydroxymuconate Delta-isomerase [Chloroflexi bacterium]|jgi:5-carboxymethyl-2-hydroxymuconate isomerase|nr:5-carboxymethyl-2-hydroxymuconate Delta-isomerase [Chloroflexota bacterium]